MVSDAAVEGLSGAAGGILALVATYPLMTVSDLPLDAALSTKSGFSILQKPDLPMSTADLYRTSYQE